MECENAVLEINFLGVLQPRSEIPLLAVVGRVRKDIARGDVLL